jgi:hypothetical protein
MGLLSWLFKKQHRAELDSHRQSVARLSALLERMGEDFEICGSETPPSFKEVESLGERLGVRLPSDYIAFAMAYGSLVCDAKDELWPEPVLGEIRPAWAFEKGLVVFGFGADAPKNVRLEFITPAFRKMAGRPLVPLIQRASRKETLCATADGRLVNFNPDRPEQEKELTLSQGFTDALVAEFETLVERMGRIKESRAAGREPFAPKAG